MDSQEVYFNVKLEYFLFILDEEEDDEDEAASKAPQPLSSSDLIKLAEGDDDLVEDLELSDDDNWEVLSTLATYLQMLGVFPVLFALTFVLLNLYSINMCM